MPGKPSRTCFLSIITLIEWLLVICLAVFLFTLIIFYNQIGSFSLKKLNSNPQKELSPTTTPISQVTFTSTSEILPSETPIQLSPSPQITFSQIGEGKNSPRGKIAFTCMPERYFQICLMQADGNDQKILTNQQANAYYPSITPDGENILFASNQNGHYEIYMLQLSIGLELKITNGPGNLSAPHTSNDGGWIIFSAESNRSSSIWKLHRNGSLPLPLTTSDWNESNPVWSPDSQRIAFTRNRGGFTNIFVMDSDGNNTHQVTDHPHIDTGRISWSPDSGLLIFSAGPNGDRDIFSVEVETNSVKQLTAGGNNSDPCFSPDGNWIAFSSSRDGDHEVFIMHTDGSNTMQLTNNSTDDWQPYWGN